MRQVSNGIELGRVRSALRRSSWLTAHGGRGALKQLETSGMS